jgi:hypothetical protein
LTGRKVRSLQLSARIALLRLNKKAVFLLGEQIFKDIKERKSNAR